MSDTKMKSALRFQKAKGPTLALASTLFFCLLHSIPYVNGHGRLIQPPSRSSAWRYGFSTPPNYNDHEIYCGGYARQWQTNGGKCGICGDPWDAPQPRANEAGGKYGLGVIVATYQEGAEIEVGVELTASHMGYFEFKVCPHNNKKVPANQECLDRYLLERADGTGPRYRPDTSRKYYMRYKLPEGLTCKQCVFQWRYVAGNNWGKCPNGTGMVGCGPQEEFRSCADISITHNDGSADNTPNVVPTHDSEEQDEDKDYSYEDYNEVDTDRLNRKPTTSGNYTAHVIALSLAGILLPLILLALILYFYFAKGTISSMLKKHACFWKKCAKSNTADGYAANAGIGSAASKGGNQGRLSFVSAPPVAPPRRHRSGSSSAVSPARVEASPSIPV